MPIILVTRWSRITGGRLVLSPSFLMTLPKGQPACQVWLQADGCLESHETVNALLRVDTGVIECICGCFFDPNGAPPHAPFLQVCMCTSLEPLLKEDVLQTGDLAASPTCHFSYKCSLSRRTPLFCSYYLSMPAMKKPTLIWETTAVSIPAHLELPGQSRRIFSHHFPLI